MFVDFVVGICILVRLNYLQFTSFVKYVTNRHRSPIFKHNCPFFLFVPRFHFLCISLNGTITQQQFKLQLWEVCSSSSTQHFLVQSDTQFSQILFPQFILFFPILLPLSGAALFSWIIIAQIFQPPDWCPVTTLHKQFFHSFIIIYVEKKLMSV